MASIPTSLIRWVRTGSPAGLLPLIVLWPSSARAQEGAREYDAADLGTIRLSAISQPGEEKPSQPADKPDQSAEPSTRELFFDANDGAFDISGFLSQKVGFLPLVVPITEPAIGYGASLGLTYFHSEPKALPGVNGEPGRVIMPSTTVFFGAGTENGTWAGAIAHLGVWNEGRIRYLGALGYASLDLDWFGRNDALNGQSIAYNNDVLFMIQRIKFKLGESDFFLGPQYRLVDTSATFDASGLNSGIPPVELESTVSGLGVNLGYDSLDHPFSPTRGWRADATVSQQAEWLGSDFDYAKIQTFAITYIPLDRRVTLGLRLNGDFIAGDAPFYDLPWISVRGIPVGRYVDENAVYGETELRWDFSSRWSAVAFVGGGVVADSMEDLLEEQFHAAGGAGFRYLIASRYGLRIGVDIAYSNDGPAIYLSVGTGWIRP